MYACDYYFNIMTKYVNIAINSEYHNIRTKIIYVYIIIYSICARVEVIPRLDFNDFVENYYMNKLFYFCANLSFL